jgi:hypothetical protein
MLEEDHVAQEISSSIGNTLLLETLVLLDFAELFIR